MPSRSLPQPRPLRKIYRGFAGWPTGRIKVWIDSLHRPSDRPGTASNAKSSDIDGYFAELLARLQMRECLANLVETEVQIDRRPKTPLRAPLEQV